MMSRIGGLVLLVLVSGGHVPRVRADVVFLRDGDPVYGRVVSVADDRLVFDQRVPTSAGYRRRTILMTDLITFVINIQPARLEQLRPAHPESYRDLAEELAVQRRDPEARDLAIRLYLLAASLGDRTLQKSCFAGLIPLARSGQEEKRFRVLAYHTLPGDWLDPLPDLPANMARPSASRQQRAADLRVALQALRRGQRQAAARVIQQPWVREFMKPHDSICTWFELRDWAAEPGLKIAWLARILELEIRLAGIRAGESTAHPPTDWATLATRTAGPLEPVNFANVSEFNLKETLFRDGDWTSDRAR